MVNDTKITIRISKELHQKVSKYCWKNRVGLSVLIRYLLKKQIAVNPLQSEITRILED